MDKNKICEAMYALPGDVVVKRRKSPVFPLALLLAGVAMIVLNNRYGAELTNNMRSALVFIGGTLALAGLIASAAKIFGTGGVPYHRGGHCYLRYEELYFERGSRGEVMQSVADGAVERLLGMGHAKVPALTVALYRTPDNRFAALQAFEYDDLEYKPLTELKIVDKPKNN